MEKIYKKKSILFIMTDLMGGGAEKALIDLLGNFDYTRYQVTLCLLVNRGIYLEDIPKEVEVIPLFKRVECKWYHYAIRLYAKWNFLCLLSFYMHLRLRKKYDTVISFLENTPAVLHRMILDRGEKNISWIHSDLFSCNESEFHYGRKSGEMQFYAQMNHLIFVSQMALQNFEKLYPLLNVPKHAIYNVIDHVAIRSLAEATCVPRSSSFTITTIGRLAPVKGFDRLIRVAAMLKKAGFSFCLQIIGTGSFDNRLKTLGKQLDVDNEIQFLGFCKPPYPHLIHSDLFVSSSVSEGLSLVICEALVLGIPVVATNTAGAIDLLENGRYGVIVEQEDEALFCAIKQLMENDALREEYRKKAVERGNLFDVRQTMEALYRLIE